MKIRSITEQDWSAIDIIQRASYPAEAQENMDAMKCHWWLSPETCFVSERGGKVEAYALSHPWILRRPPPINTVYSSLPPQPDSLYLHDVAFLPEARGRGFAKTLVEHVLSIGLQRGLARCSLISVQGSRGFWEKCGFHPELNLPPDFFNDAHAHYRDRTCVYMIRP